MGLLLVTFFEVLFRLNNSWSSSQIRQKIVIYILPMMKMLTFC